MTHDSIGLGEDGPTHQPIEHLQACARSQLDGLPSRRCGRDRRMLGAGAGRQRRAGAARAEPPELPQLRTKRSREFLRARRLPLRAAAAARKVVLIATGSEVEVALAVAERLKSRGSAPTSCRCRAAGLSSPGRGPIAATSCPAATCCVSIEAGATFGWERYTGRHGLEIGLDRFGASAPAGDCSSISASPPTRSCRTWWRRWNLRGDQ